MKQKLHLFRAFAALLFLVVGMSTAFAQGVAKQFGITPAESYINNVDATSITFTIKGSTATANLSSIDAGKIKFYHPTYGSGDSNVPFEASNDGNNVTITFGTTVNPIKLNASGVVYQLTFQQGALTDDQSAINTARTVLIYVDEKIGANALSIEEGHEMPITFTGNWFVPSATKSLTTGDNAIVEITDASDATKKYSGTVKQNEEEGYYYIETSTALPAAKTIEGTKYNVAFKRGLFTKGQTKSNPFSVDNCITVYPHVNIGFDENVTLDADQYTVDIQLTSLIPETDPAINPDVNTDPTTGDIVIKDSEGNAISIIDGEDEYKPTYSYNPTQKVLTVTLPQNAGEYRLLEGGDYTIEIPTQMFKSLETENQAKNIGLHVYSLIDLTVDKDQDMFETGTDVSQVYTISRDPKVASDTFEYVGETVASERSRDNSVVIIGADGADNGSERFPVVTAVEGQPGAFEVAIPEDGEALGLDSKYVLYFPARTIIVNGAYKNENPIAVALTVTNKITFSQYSRNRKQTIDVSKKDVVLQFVAKEDNTNAILSEDMQWQNVKFTYNGEELETEQIANNIYKVAVDFAENDDFYDIVIPAGAFKLNASTSKQMTAKVKVEKLTFDFNDDATGLTTTTADNVTDAMTAGALSYGSRGYSYSDLPSPTRTGKYNEVNYTRDFERGSHAIALPFDFKVTEDWLDENEITLARLTAVVENENGTALYFTTVKDGETIYANMPYILRTEAAKANKTLKFENVTFVNPTSETVTSATTTTEYTFTSTIGVVTPGEHFKYSKSTCSFSRYSATAKVQPWRWYMTANGKGISYARVIIDGFEDGESSTTGIKPVVENIENGEIYNINGMKLKNFQKGINIVNGKKIIIK